jgi:hypothetical protein
MPGTIGSRGNVLYCWMVAPTLTPASVGANTTAEQSFTINGLQVSDFVDVYYWGPNTTTPGPQTTGIGIANNRVSAANTLQIGFMNNTGGSLTPAAGVYYLNISRPEVSINQLPTTAA